jgi:hypothetical protein
MRMPLGMVLICAALDFIAADASAQSRLNVGLLLGSTATTNEGSALQFDRGTTYQATFAWPVWGTGATSLSIEVPFIASPAFTVTTPGASLPLEYASLYLTPGARVTFLTNAPVSFFGALGGGYARYTESKLKADRSANPNQRDTNAGALEFGAGVDVRAFGWVGFRVELRDVYTGSRTFSIQTPRPKVHNVVGSGGLVIRF